MKSNSLELEAMVIVEDLDEALEATGYMHGIYTVELTSEHIEALKNGKCVAYNPDDEYAVHIVCKGD